MLTARDFFDLSGFLHPAIFHTDDWVWRTLVDLEDYLANWFADTLPAIDGEVSKHACLYGDQISIGSGTVIEDGVTIHGPAIIGSHCEIRQGAYIRGNAILGDSCVLGHASELKHSIMLNHAQAPHFAYVGDSILGGNVNLGAGTKLSNLTVSSVRDEKTGKRPTITLMIDGETIDTGLTKLGAILGDGVQTGCNAVTNPGCLIGPDTLVYPNTSISKGYIPGNNVVKLRQELTITARQ